MYQPGAEPPHSVSTRMFSPVFDSDTLNSKSWSNFSWRIYYSPLDKRTTLEYVVNHVFFPVYHPQHNDYTKENAHALARAVQAAACAYNGYMDRANRPHWLHITKMLENLQITIGLTQRYSATTISQLAEMQVGGRRLRSSLVYLFQEPTDTLVFPVGSHAVMLWKREDCTLCELLCLSQSPPGEEMTGSYPEQAIEIPNESFDEGLFQSRLASLLHLKDTDTIITILNSTGHPVKYKHLTKRRGPSSLIQDVLWSRSNLWFLIRVAIQLFLDRSPLGLGSYKTFMLFFMCSLASYAVNTSPSSLLLHAMSAKLFRRFRKVGPSVPQWLCDIVSRTFSNLSETLDQRSRDIQATTWCPSPHWNPSQLDLIKDSQPILPHIHEYLSTLAAYDTDPSHTFSLPDYRYRCTLTDFLSCPEELSCRDDIHVTLFDVERAVAEGINDWVGCVTNVDEACERLGRFVHQYYCQSFTAYPHHLSIMFLTIIEIWVALDKLVVKEIPILADYSPQVPIDILSGLLLHGPVDIHRVSRAYQYLFSRHTRAQPGWSALSNEFSKHSFPCRYYDCSFRLQCLKGNIEDKLPAEPLHAKAVVFELQCPVPFDTWRSVTCWISGTGTGKERVRGDVAVCDIPSLQLCVPGRRMRQLSLYTARSAPRSWGRLYYAYDGIFMHRFGHGYKLPSGQYAGSGLQRCLDNTTHTPNEVLAAQENCDPNLSSHEFIAFAQLRSGGSLQWLNILRELRSRTLDFRHQEVYLLLAQAVAEVGPLDSTGQLLWHLELQDASFFHVLLDELESLFTNIGVGSLDGPAMAIISLLAGITASNAPGYIPERAIKLLLNVREKTFSWVHELLYNARQSPTNKESLGLLRDMAAVCRITFDVGLPTTMSHKLLHSPRDIEIVLSCAMIMHTMVQVIPLSSDVPMYSRVLLDRDRHLSLVLEDTLRDAIQTDVSDLGIDRAIQMVWPSYRPSSCRWDHLQSPNSRWLTCQTAPTSDRRLQIVQINLLDGSLLVDGKPIGKRLTSDVTSDLMYQKLFGDNDLMVVASDLPGMDFVTMSAIHKHHVHFAVRNGKGTSGSRESRNVVIRAQREDTQDIFDLVPWENLQRDLPKLLIEGHIHWLSLSTSIIEVRPIEKPWEQSWDNWSIHLRPSGQCYVKKGDEFLVNVQSPTWTMVSNRLRCLDEPENLVIAVSPTDPERLRSPSLRLSVTLPRYGISFFVNEADNLESRDFKDMVYDEDQYIGTLFGLVNRLILRPRIQPEVDLIPKLILIPHGDYLDEHGHNVYLKLPSSGPVKYYTYQEDSELGCLKGIISLTSRLYLADLHACTSSGCRPDPLTGRTGVEEAISLIWLAGGRQQTYEWTLVSKSPQIHFALAKIQDHIDNNNSRPLHEDAVLQEAYLFPSEVAASLQLRRKGPLHSLDQLFYERLPPDLHPRIGLPRHKPRCYPPSINLLRQLFSSLQTDETAPAFQSQYITRLHSSAHYFQTVDLIGIASEDSSTIPCLETLRRHYVQCRANYIESLGMLKRVLGPQTEFEWILNQSGLWPRITPFILFRCLASTSPIKLSRNWEECLTSLALLALDLQRARRLLQFALDGLEEELYKELDGEGCNREEAVQYPDWLLIQLQGNFFIRRVQIDVAKEMISPRSGKNTVMQVHMGEGKSSVIIPICSTALADGNQLVRIVVPKALIPQTLQLLTDRLSGLVDRPIYHLTFSRGDMNVCIGRQSKVEHLHKVMAKCRDECGIIVIQPEDVLSLKLACVETQLLKNGVGTNPIQAVQKWGFEHVLRIQTGSLAKSLIQKACISAVLGGLKQSHHEPETHNDSIEHDDRPQIKSKHADTLLKLQKFFDTHARDLFDESDDILRPQIQLIYAIGNQQPLEGSPDRWVIVQQVLGLVRRHALLLSTPDSHTIRCDSSSPGSFPRIHILQHKGGEQLKSLIAQDVLDGHLSSLSFHSELGLRGSVHDFMLRKDIHSDTVQAVEQYARQSTGWGLLLLLRGLLAHDILLFALTQRRWRVDYGPDPSSPPRTMLAIPYRAKDVPAQTAEFGHPDITILLTCLSYYYEGLGEKQLRISFELLLQEDDPSSEYALWIEDCGIASVPKPFQRLSGVNIRSLEQWTKHLVPLFTRNKRAIDLYLAKVVFAKHTKEFPQRISGSSWDIAERKNHLVTGFSGTNDGQYLLPTSIVQDDPDYLLQTGTNARVLAYLLQPENSSYVVTSGKNGVRWTTLELLENVISQHPHIRVLLDVGAQILDLTNLQIAKAWLNRTSSTEIAGSIYFSEADELMVLARNGTTQPLSSSPLNQQLHRCVAYLDDAHTRGTDLKFPPEFRAAVTLGHKVTNDRLVQGCMRMRKLGHGHSVMFFAPHEVDQRIRSLVAKESPDIQVSTADVLHWAIRETWSDIQRRAPYWAQQGMSHQSRYEAWSRFRQNEDTPKELADAWVQSDLKSLIDMYMPHHSPDITPPTNLSRRIRDHCANLGALSLPDVRMDEEQERDVSREIEREREVENWAPRATPAIHSLHPDLVQVVKTGVVPSPFWSKAIRYVFATDTDNKSVTSSPGRIWSSYILATADFCETTKKKEPVQGRKNDNLRPVQWVLSAKMYGKDTLVLLSPFEADRLMPEIRISEHVHLHLYIPRSTKRMRPSDDLRLYSVPPVPPGWTPPWDLIDQLNVFAGQLYLSDYTSYVRLCRFLRVETGLPHRDQAATVVGYNWSNNPDSFSEEVKNRFEGTPLPLVMQLLAVRRGMSFAGTHMGRILEGWPLTEGDFQDLQRGIINSAE